MQNKYLRQYQASVLRQCQLKQLEILEHIDAVCRRHDIPYWLDAGTLLGAVRHGGFIPWDDDIDIAMKEEDLVRFLAIAPKELPENLYVQNPEEEPTKEPLVKIRDLNSFYVEGSDNFASPYEKGVFVDIFPYVVYPNVSAAFIRRITKGIARSRAILHKAHYYSLRSCAELFYFGTKLLCFRAVWCAAKILFPASRSRRTGYAPILNGCGNSHLLDTVYPLSTVKFEGKSFPAPADVDVYLTDLFRNYMQVPPPEKREIHSVFIMPELVKEP